MIDELNQAIAQYKAKWEALVAERKAKIFFEGLRPTSVAWKTEDLADFDKRFADLREHSDQIHLGRVNDRWLATFHLKDTALNWNMSVVKLMQRRPGSTDAVGLDHLDFWLPKGSQAKQMVEKESDLKWTEEMNGDHCKWLSIWFNNTEAKLRSDTVLEVCVAEMQDVHNLLMEQL